jgi:hypothetical protein
MADENGAPARIQALLATAPVIDGHNDLPWRSVAGAVTT